MYKDFGHWLEERAKEASVLNNCFVCGAVVRIKKRWIESLKGNPGIWICQDCGRKLEVKNKVVLKCANCLSYMFTNKENALEFLVHLDYFHSPYYEIRSERRHIILTTLCNNCASVKFKGATPKLKLGGVMVDGKPTFKLK